MSSKIKKTNHQKARREQLAKRTVQIIGFGFAVFLTCFKLYNIDADIPWYVIFGFFGFGASADFGFLKNIGKR